MLRVTLLLALGASPAMADQASVPPPKPVEPGADADRPQTHPTAYFDEVGQVCLSVPQREALLRAIQEAKIRENVQLALVAYSDGVEMRATSWNGESPCGHWSLPTFLTGHDRVAALRAYHVLSVLQAAGVSAATRTPVLLLGAGGGESPPPVMDRSVTITLARSTVEGAHERRVVLYWYQPAPQTLENSDRTTPIRPQEYSNWPPKDANHSAEHSARWQKWYGLSALVVGAASAGLSIGLAALAGVRSNEARGVLDVAHRQELGSQSYGLGIAAGSSFVVAAGLTITGSLALWEEARRAKRGTDQRAVESQPVSPLQTSLLR